MAVGTRFDTLTREIGDAFIRVEFDGKGHSTLTEHRQQEGVDRVLAFFAEKLQPLVTARRGLFVAPFDALADPRVIGDLAARAEGAGWEGFFLWDHLQYGDRVTDIADVWTCCAAVAMRTSDAALRPDGHAAGAPAPAGPGPAGRLARRSCPAAGSCSASASATTGSASSARTATRPHRGCAARCSTTGSPCSPGCCPAQPVSPRGSALHRPGRALPPGAPGADLARRAGSPTPRRCAGLRRTTASS